MQIESDTNIITGIVQKSKASPPLWMRKNLKYFLHIYIKTLIYELSLLWPSTLGILRIFFATLLIVVKNVARLLKTWKMLQSQCCKDFGIFQNVAKFMLQEFWKFLQHFFSNVAKKTMVAVRSRSTSRYAAMMKGASCTATAIATANREPPRTKNSTALRGMEVTHFALGAKSKLPKIFGWLPI